jgi:hypothetical protein
MAKRQSNRRILIRSVRKNPPDLHKLGRALIALALAQAEAEAEAQDAEAKKTALDADETRSEDKT